MIQAKITHLLSLVAESYPNFKPAESTASIWQGHLGKFPEPVLVKAALRCMDSDPKWPPTAPSIKAACIDAQEHQRSLQAALPEALGALEGERPGETLADGLVRVSATRRAMEAAGTGSYVYWPDHRTRTLGGWYEGEELLRALDNGGRRRVLDAERTSPQATPRPPEPRNADTSEEAPVSDG